MAVGTLAGSISIAGAQSIQLTATIHFDRANRRGEQINQQPLGTNDGKDSAALPIGVPLLRTKVAPPFIRADIGFDESGCPDNPNGGPLYNRADNTFDYCRIDQRIEQALAVRARP